jgi:rubrerythrin
MKDPMSELIELAVDREIVSQAFYIAARKQVGDPGARELLSELAAEEGKHLEKVKALREKGFSEKDLEKSAVPNLMISEYLVDTTISEGSSLQDVITIAMKREQQSVEYYSGMARSIKKASAKQLCEKLAQAESGHKKKLEIFYDDLFLKED